MDGWFGKEDGKIARMHVRLIGIGLGLGLECRTYACGVPLMQRVLRCFTYLTWGRVVLNSIR